MNRIFFILALLATACSGTATKKDELGGRNANPDTVGFFEAEPKALTTSPYMTELKLNEIYADTSDYSGVVGTFTFTAPEKLQLVLGYEEVQCTEPAQAGGALPTYVLLRADGAKQGLLKDEAFVVEAQEPVTLRVSQPNPAKCRSLDVVFGVNSLAL